MSDDCDFKLPLLKECQPLDLPTIVPENYELEFPLLKPPCIPSFSGSATVTVRPVKLDGQNNPINKDIKLNSDPNSECSYKMSGNIDICVPEADAYIDGADIKWYNKGGTKTTYNGTTQSSATSGTITSYSPTTQHIFKFWNCSDSNATDPDRSQVIAANGTNGTSGTSGTTPCLIDADAYEDTNITVPPKLKWFNRGGGKTTIKAGDAGTDINQSNTGVGGANQTEAGEMPYDCSLYYTFKFWKCHANNDTPDKTITIKPGCIYPLKLIPNSSDPAIVRLVYGSVAGKPAKDSMNVGDVPVCLLPQLTNNTLNYIYSKFFVTYDTNYAYWYPTSDTRTIEITQAPQSSTSQLVYMLIGTVNVSNTGVATVSNNVTGSQTWSRSGTPDKFYDLFYKT